jgi:acyl-[acyl-carrier-protein]-phospholipid O-acyltransferase/long-chain-fatty-acid--[acyl-carrier-protein] ligase
MSADATLPILLGLAWPWWLLVLAMAIPTVMVLGIWLAPIGFVRFVVGFFCHSFYRIRVLDREQVPTTGPVLITPNHVSWMDGFLVMLLSPRPMRTMVYAGNFQFWWIRWLADRWGAIMISPGPKSIVRALRTANAALKNGEVVGIFPEGGISRNGTLQGFKPGVMKVLEGTEAVVVPMYLDGLWGSIFSFERGRFFWKWPKRIPYPITVYFGEPLRGVTDPSEIRSAVERLAAHAFRERRLKMMTVPEAALRACKKRKFRSKVADSSGADFTGGVLLMRSLILRRLLRRNLLRDTEQHVGVLLPPAAGAVAANMALALDRRVAVNLNYTTSSDVMNRCLDLAEIKHVLTSRRFMEKMEFQLDAELVYLEDFRDQVRLWDKIVAAIQAYALPASLLSRGLGLNRVDRDEVLTVIFTSGSTGTPKGVMLTYANIASNVAAIDQVIGLEPRDVIVGILPFFHSFGFTVTLWSVLALDIKGIYHFSPLDARQVGKLIKRHGGTILLATPTFLRSYVRRCEQDELASIDTVVAGAEKLPPDLCDAFEKKFGVRPVEGYGTTELSPLVSVNIPPSRQRSADQLALREGSVGRCVPGVCARVVDLDTGEPLPVGKDGMLMVRGANVMKGYLKAEEKTAEVIRDGWYVTGDVAHIDGEGFIHITGRESRFSKIGGEMVPHVKIEQLLQQFVGLDEEERPSIAVTAIPDEKKGERLVVLHTDVGKTPAEMCQALQAAGLPNLFIPSSDSFLQLPELPLLGTGKLDLKGLRQRALEKFAR